MSEGYVNESEEQMDLGFKMCHTFFNGWYDQSNFLPLLHPIFNILQPRALVRVQAVMTPRADEVVKTGFHTDVSNCITALYYINTTDGSLYFEDGTEIETLENRLVIFDSNLRHSGTKCTDSDRRTLINFNYYERSETDNEYIFN
jgi:hypothetical protein